MLATRNSKKTQTASAGHGPLWQRDYWAELEQSTLVPEAIVLLMRTDFIEFSPDSLAKFSRPDNGNIPLQVGDEMKIEVRGAGTCEVRCVHVEPRSFTLRTLDGHMEAGRITFGAYLENGRTVVRIRSRARSASRRRHVAYLIMGHALQAKAWITFLARVAERCGVPDAKIQHQTKPIKSTLADLGEIDTPTFIAKDM